MRCRLAHQRNDHVQYVGHRALSVLERCVCHFHSSRITRISYGTRLSQSSVRRMQTGPGRPSFCSFQPLVFSSRDCFSIGLLPFCPPFACGGFGVLACPHTTAVHVERSIAFLAMAPRASAATVRSTPSISNSR